jgi:putative transposase
LESGLEKGPDDEAQEAYGEQIIAILKEHEAGVKTADLCRKHGISEASFYNWKAKYGGLEVSEAKRLKGLESENARLKKLLADAMLDNAALKDLLAKNVWSAPALQGLLFCRQKQLA